MKLLTIVVSILTFLQLVPQTNMQSPLLEMVQVADDQNISITSWKIYVQDTVSYAYSKKEADQQVKQLIESAKAYTFQEDESTSSEYSKLVGYKDTSSPTLKESAVITIYEEEDKFRISRTYEVLGSKWSENLWKYVSSTYKEELKNSEKVFYSLYGTKALDQNLEQVATDLMTEFNAETVEEMKEEQFISLSAYRDDWKVKLPTKGGKAFNLQVGVRLDSEKKIADIAMGTPIITSGY
ncbi:YwmB family TATA-box binding protein [Bacillus pinisoli]|uniref:YwmB family TATA-box binding protein n=1 Tax=Bacillus pinisoli TaxID=2901866 RepID=UPI001FF6BBFB|nr:YwmB family TATA-box binding protein [Bacillus pinisoli]